MTILQAVLMGIIQGLSEFLPVSSSAHIVFTSNIYKIITGAPVVMENSQEIFLSIMLHVGTLISILIFFRKEIVSILKSLITAIKTRNFSNQEAMLAIYIMLGTIFTIAIAYPLKDITERLVYSPKIVAGLLIITGFVLFLSEFVSKHYKAKTNKMNLKSAIIIGIAQGFAVFPGFSRSGWTIAAGLFSGLDRVSCTKYSFLLVIPIILATSIMYPIMEIQPSELVTYNWVAIILGTIISAIVGYFCIKYFLKFVQKFSLNLFAYYCIIMGCIVIGFFMFN